MMRTCVCVVVATVSLCPALFASDEMFLLSYFKGNGETGVYLAASEDGLTFKDLNESRPIFTRPRVVHCAVRAA